MPDEFGPTVSHSLPKNTSKLAQESMANVFPFSSTKRAHLLTSAAAPCHQLPTGAANAIGWLQAAAGRAAFGRNTFMWNTMAGCGHIFRAILNWLTRRHRHTVCRRHGAQRSVAGGIPSTFIWSRLAEEFTSRWLAAVCPAANQWLAVAAVCQPANPPPLPAFGLSPSIYCHFPPANHIFSPPHFPLPTCPSVPANAFSRRRPAG